MNHQRINIIAAFICVLFIFNSCLTDSENDIQGLACIENDASFIIGRHALYSINGSFIIGSDCYSSACQKFDIIFRDDNSYELDAELYFNGSDTLVIEEAGTFTFECLDRFMTSNRIVVEVVESHITLSNNNQERLIWSTLGPHLDLQFLLLRGFDELDLTLFLVEVP